MRKFFRSPLFRCLVCLILVCCILVNVSPIRAKAFAGLSASALIYLLYAAAAGAVIVPASLEIANAIGQKVDEDIEIRVNPEIFDVWFNLCDEYDNLVPEWDPNDWNDNLKHGLAGGLLAAISAMMIELVVEGCINVIDNSVITDEFSYEFTAFNNQNYTVSSSEPFSLIGFYSPFFGTERLATVIAVSSVPGVLNINSSSNDFIYISEYDCYYSVINTLQWTEEKTLITGDFPVINTEFSNISSFLNDCLNLACNYFISGGQTITIEPDIYVGDLPDQIRDGEKDEENLNLPIIDPFKIIQSPETAYEDVTQTLQDLKDGVITYDEYIEKVTADEDTTVDPSDPTESTDPTEDPEAIPEDIAPYTFDLRDIFPFCIPFDLYDFLTVLDATPVAPVINWELTMPGGGTYPITLDLSVFDSVAQLLRRLELLVFTVALAIKTRDLIKG